MSCPIHCPECDAFQGDVGLTARGEEECSECGARFELANQTLAEVEG